jgi:hypothetical protein
MVTERKAPEFIKNRIRFVRLSAFEDDLLTAIMTHEHVNASAALRMGIREAAKARDLWPVDRPCHSEDGDASAMICPQDQEAAARRGLAAQDNVKQEPTA